MSDGRVTEHPVLTVVVHINTLFGFVSVWQARKIAIDELQHIIYTEYLPGFIGIPIFLTFRLNLMIRCDDISRLKQVPHWHLQSTM